MPTYPCGRRRSSIDLPYSVQFESSGTGVERTTFIARHFWVSKALTAIIGTSKARERKYSIVTCLRRLRHNGAKKGASTSIASCLPATLPLYSSAVMYGWTFREWCCTSQYTGLRHVFGAGAVNTCPYYSLPQTKARRASSMREAQMTR